MHVLQSDRSVGSVQSMQTGDWNPVNRMTINDAMTDSPLFRQNLTRAELIAAHVQAHYQLTLETCRIAMKTGEAFASALFNLTRCLDIDLLPKQTCSVADLPSRWSGVSYDACKGLAQVNESLTRFARQVRQFSVELAKPERLMDEARSQLNHLFDLRANFQRVCEQLDAAIARAASLAPGRSYVEYKNADAQVSELRVTQRQAAEAYLTGLRAAISSTPLITFLQANQMLLNAKQILVDDHPKFTHHQKGSVQPVVPEHSVSNLIGFLAKLTSWAETGRRLDHEKQSMVDVTPPFDEKDTSVSSTSFHTTPACGLEGYLFKRSSKRTWRSWSRRWFRLRDNQLVYCKRLPDLSASELQSFTDATLNEMRSQLGRTRITTERGKSSARLSFEDLLAQIRPNTVIKPQWKVMEPDLHLCTAREGSAGFERRFTFELISPGNRIHLLQAESFVEKERWVEALRTGLLRLQQQSNGSLNPCSSPEVNRSAAASPQNVEGQRALSETTAVRVRQHNQNNRSNHTTTATTTTATVEGTTSQQSIPDYDRLRSQGGIALWREPDLAGNRQCADCSAEETNWASINLGVTLCTQCAAAHRGLGVHISKIRSLTLDNWEPEQLHVMLNMGNRLVNMIYEAHIRQTDKLTRPTVHSSSEHRRQWARAKWVHCQFARLPATELNSDKSASDWIRQLYDAWCALRERQQQQQHSTSSGTPNSDRCEPQKSQHKVKASELNKDRAAIRQSHRRAILDDLCQTFDDIANQQRKLNQSRKISHRGMRGSATLLRTEQKCQDMLATRLLSTGARLGCPPLMLAGLAGGAHPDGDRATARYNTNSRTGTMDTPSTQPPLILTVRSGSLAACEFLLLNGADIDVQDDRGRTALFHACRLQRVHLVCLLLRRRADQMRADRQGRVPLDIAIEMANADIVTLLRLQRLHEDNKESDYMLTDDTVTDVFRDFTCRAYTHDSSEDLSDYTLLSEPRYSTSSPALAQIIDGSDVSNLTSPSTTSSSTCLRSPTRSSPSRLASPGITTDNRRRVRSITTGGQPPATNTPSFTASPVHAKPPKVLLVRSGAQK